MSSNTVRSIQEPARAVPVCADVDVLVVGGGPAGIIAAMAAAGNGLKVALVESRSFVGGNLTLGLPILGFLSQKGKPIITGLPLDATARIAKQLKQKCGSGGTIRNGVIEIQGDHRTAAMDELRKQGFTVKLAGG